MGGPALWMRPSTGMGVKPRAAKENYLALAPKDRQALLDWLQGLKPWPAALDA